MNPGSGSLAIAARRSGTRTVLDRVRYDGISRCSRAFRLGDAALIVLSQLGPGVVRGDSIVLDGHVQRDAHLIVTSQSATRVLGGPSQAAAIARWRVDAGALLEIIGEPLIADAGAAYVAGLTIDLGPGARVILSEIACVPAGARVVLRTSIRQNAREIFYDAIAAADAAPLNVGTFTAAGLNKREITACIAALDRIGDDRPAMRLGIGELRDGVFARVLATDVWSLRGRLERLRQTTLDALATVALV